MTGPGFATQDALFCRNDDAGAGGARAVSWHRRNSKTIENFAPFAIVGS